MIGTRKRTINDTTQATTRRRAGTSWTAPSRLIGAFAALAAFASAVGFSPMQAQAAPSLSVSLAIIGIGNPGVPATTLRAGGCVTVQVSYSVGGEDLSNAKIRMSLPAEDWNNLPPSTGAPRAIGLPFSGAPTFNVVTETWATQYTSPDSIIDLPIGNPDVPAGTVGAVTVNLCSNNGVNPNGALLDIAASLVGTNGVLAAAPISIANYASNGVFPGNVSKTATTIVPALGPPTVNTTSGYELSWNVELGSPCTTTGCGPIVGNLIDSMPVGSYLSSVSRIGLTSTTPIVPAPHPATGLDISSFPAVGTQFTAGNRDVTVPVFIWPSLCTSISGSGALSQGKTALPETSAQTCTAEYPVSVNRRGFRVTVWVPLPAGLTTVTNTFALNRDPAWDAITSPVVKTASHTLDGTPSLTFTKSFNNSGSGDCTALAAPYQPGQAVVGDSRCTIYPEGIANDYILRFNSTAPVSDAYVIDKLPAPLQLRSMLVPPAGWSASYTTDATCALSTSPTDPMWTTVLPPLAAVSCVMFTNPLTDTLANTLVVPILVRPGQTPTPGNITLVSNTARATGSNLTAASVNSEATRVVSILNRQDLTQQVSVAPASVVAGNQTVVRMYGQDLPLLGNFGAHNWTMETTLPADLDFVPNGMTGNDFLVFTSPKDAAAPLTNLPVTCSYTPATRLVRCVATGDALDATATTNVIFDIRFAARVRLGATNDQPLTAYGYNDLGTPASYSSFGPVDSAGDSLSFIDTPTHKGSANATIDVISSPALNLSKTVDGGATDVLAGDTISYTLSVNHLANSTADLTNAYIYDFMGRNPATGAVIGSVAPIFVSTNVGSQPITINYTCTAAPTIATSVWVASPCGTVTGLRFRPAYDDQLNVATDGLYPIGAATLSIGITVQTPGSAPHLGTVANQAGVTSDQQPGTLLSSRPSVTVHQPADLSILKTDSGNTGAAIGSTITYTVNVSNGVNNDALPSSLVVVTDTLPASLAPDNAVGAGWTCGLAGQTFTCSRTSALAANTALPIITITATVLPGAPASISNTAVITGPSDTNPINDQSTVVTATLQMPAAIDDAFALDSQATITSANILGNDGASPLAPLNPSTVSVTPMNPGEGTITYNGDGTITYTAAVGPGTFSTTYTVCDTQPTPRCDTATITFTVAAPVPTTTTAPPTTTTVPAPTTTTIAPTTTTTIAPTTTTTTPAPTTTVLPTTTTVPVPTTTIPVPTTTVPAPTTTTTPVITVPVTTVPVTTVPMTTVPVTTVPATTVPPTTAPATTGPTTTILAPTTTLTQTTPATSPSTTTARAATTAPGPLPVTGSDAGRLLMLACCFLVFGLLMLALGRHRRSANA